MSKERPWRWWGFVCIDVWFNVGSWKHVKCFCKSVLVYDSAVFPTLRFRFPRNLLRWNLYRNEQFAFRFIPGLLWHMFHIFYFEHAFGFRSPLPGFLHACALWSLSPPDFQSIQLWSLFVQGCIVWSVLTTRDGKTPTQSYMIGRPQCQTSAGMKYHAVAQQVSLLPNT